jgi:hypothetical protein
MQERIDVEAVNKEDFSELFKSCYLVIVRSNREEKLQAAAAILANILLRPGDPAKSSYEELDHLIRCIDLLSIGAISVLGAARRIAETAGQGMQRSVPFNQLRSAFTTFDASLVMSFVSELRSLNLLRTQEGAPKRSLGGNYASRFAANRAVYRRQDVTNRWAAHFWIGTLAAMRRASSRVSTILRARQKNAVCRAR